MTPVGLGAPALEVVDLRVTYPGPSPVQALDGLSLSVMPGQCLGILGESGSGKSTLAMALLGLLDTAQISGSIRLAGRDVTALSEEEWRQIRWRGVALAFQSAGALNPVLKVGDQVAEPLIVHMGSSRSHARAAAAGVLTEVGLGEWALDRYPMELSGGQRRLVLLASALVCDPAVAVLDEPTSGLDPRARQRVLQVLARRRQEGSMAVVAMTHDVDALEVLADHTTVLYRGWVAESGPAPTVLHHPRAPYTWALLNARPTLASVKDLRGIRGDPPDPTVPAVGCPFLGRCTQSIDDCSHDRPPVVAPPGEDGERKVACVRGGVVKVLSARGLRKSYELSGGVLRHRTVPAVDGISVDVHEGEVVGLVGATGAGKSTLAMLLVRLIEADGGTLELEGEDFSAAAGDTLKAMRRGVQLLFQDPYAALSPRLDVAAIVAEPLVVAKATTPEARLDMVRTALAATRLPASDAFLGRRTHELSGGQLQRVALARALILEPKVLVADEPVAMLDPSEAAKLMQLLKQLQVERGMAMVLISHDLATVLRTADRVLVLDDGKVVEEGTGSRLLASPRHEATRRLLAAAGRDLLFAPSGPA